MNIAVVGTGYVGLVTGACFSDKGNHVICVDNDPVKLAKLQNGEIPIFEPGLEEVVSRNFQNKNLEFTDDLGYAVKSADIIFFCLPTPTLEDGTSDTKYIFGVAKEIGQYFNEFKIIVNKSTVPVGTCEETYNIIKQSNPEYDFTVVSNPEFLREGFAVSDFMEPDRVVVGVDNDLAQEKLKQLYSDFLSTERILFMDVISSEMSKYAANSFLAVKISFMNEVANLCHRIGADVELVKKSIGLDPRIGSRFLNPGIGYGGSCFPKDVKALQTTSKENNYEFRLLNSIIESNKDQTVLFTDRINSYFEQSLLPKKVALWGITFKPNTDDIRESPAIKVLINLINLGFEVTVYDPEGLENLKKYYASLDCIISDDKYSALEGNSALIVATEWSEFVESDLNMVGEKLDSPVIFDGRNIFDNKNSILDGFDYFSVGRQDLLNITK